MDDIEQKVKKIIAEQLGIKEEDIKNESSFIEDLGADSLTTVEMSLALEDAFDIELPDTEQETLRTVQQAIAIVKAAVAKLFERSGSVSKKAAADHRLEMIECAQ